MEHRESLMDEIRVLSGALSAYSAALREIVISLPPEGPVRARLAKARETQLRAIAEQEPTGVVLFAAERAWDTLLVD